MSRRNILLAFIATAMMVIPQPVRAAICTFAVIPSPNEAPDSNDLSGVSASSANDAWAVGVGGSRLSPMTAKAGGFRSERGSRKPANPCACRPTHSSLSSRDSALRYPR